MTSGDLIEAFDTLVEAPNGVAQLRQAILRLAMRGALVPQDLSEEPATALITRVQEERRLLIEAKALRQQKERPRLRGDELRIPPGWALVRLGDVFDFEYGKSLPKKARNAKGSVPVYGSNGCVGRHDQALVQEACIVVGRKGSAGAVNMTEGPCWPIDTCYFVVPRGGMHLPFATHLLATAGLDELDRATAIPGLNREDAYRLPILVPPAGEQHRIVAKVDELMELLDRLEAARHAREATRVNLRDSALAALRGAESSDELAVAWQRVAAASHFLFVTPDDVAPVRQAVLQLAVRGKLVPRRPTRETATQLVERMRSTRKKRLESEVSTNKESGTILRKLDKLSKRKPPTPPYQLPVGWECLRLLDASERVVDCHNKTAPYVKDGIPIVRTTNVRDGEIVWRNMKYITDQTYQHWARRCPPRAGDIIFTREAPMGEAAVIPDGVKVCLGQRTMLVRPMEDFVLGRYLLLALLEPGVVERAAHAAVGMTVKHLRVGDVESLAIPVPPREEQEQIVAKTDELLSVLDRLERQLARTCTAQAAFASAAVRGFGAASTEIAVEYRARPLDPDRATGPHRRSGPELAEHQDHC